VVDESTFRQILQAFLKPEGFCPAIDTIWIGVLLFEFLAHSSSNTLIKSAF
jgi:hypothetical protein